MDARRPQRLLAGLALGALAPVAMLSACSAGSSRPKGGLVAEVASYDLAVGPPGRFIVGLLAADQRPIGYGTVTTRFCILGAGSGTACSYGAPATASFLAIPGTAPPHPAPRSPQLVDAATQRGVYGVQVGFDRPGSWQVEVAANVGGRAYRATVAFTVSDRHQVPAVGDPALPTQNLTLTSPGAAPAAIDSRATSVVDVPDPQLHTTTIARALAAHRPIVAVFATPVYCISRFCGPVTDLVAALASTYRDRASFVHVEIWQDFQNQQLNDAAKRWLLESTGDLQEPWVFVIGADGRIVARFDNVVTRDELEPLLAALPRIGTGP